MSKHKALIDAIIDGEVEAVTIIEKSLELGVPLAEQLNRVTEAILKNRAEGRITPEMAQKAYTEVYRAVSLAGFARVAAKVQEHGEFTSKNINTAARMLGKDILTTPAIRKADFLNREMEKRGISDGDFTPDIAPKSE